ncbi:MAG: response regulator [Nitrospirae bacterium]|nr:response regulator [Nitrospirota bacterium]
MPQILVIDDEPLTRSTVVTILNREGFSVEEAADGQSGIAMIHKNPPDVVITDIFMPSRDGIEIIMELKRSRPRTKIIAMTGGGQRRMMELASAAKLLGADHILYKPFERESLLAMVNAALGTPPPPRSQDGA